MHIHNSLLRNNIRFLIVSSDRSSSDLSEYTIFEIFTNISLSIKNQ